MQIDRKLAAQIGQDTIRILSQGLYQTKSGLEVDLRQALAGAVEGTISYPPGIDVISPAPSAQHTDIQVKNETTLQAAERLVRMGVSVATLNFASATNPGGGFLSGARAQEESLVRSSGLYACIAGNPMYDFHRARHDSIYTDYIIYSPHVPVFRTDEGTLLEQPYLCSFLTSPAVNAKVVLARDPSRRSEIRLAMKSRIYKILSVAALHKHTTLILGAWGCGAFGNNANDIANLFHDALTTQHKGLFTQIMFAITDRSDGHRFIGPFQQVFGQNT